MDYTIHISEVYCTYTKNLPKFTMTQKVYLHATKYTFNPDPVWDQKWNYMDPGFIFKTKCRRPKIFRTMYSVR